MSVGPTDYNSTRFEIEPLNMKRDLNLYRDILLALEKLGTPWDHGGVQVNKNEGFQLHEMDANELPQSIREEQPEVLTRHAQLMIQAGLLEGDNFLDKEGIPPLASIHGVTHEGYEFLENVRDDTIWNRALAITGSASLNVIKTVSAGLTKSAAGL